MKLTATMRTVLETAKIGELRRDADGWPYPAPTLHALVRHGFLVTSERRNRKGYKMTIWTITDAGREAIKPIEVVRVERPLFMARIVGAKGDYTPVAAKAIDDLEVISTLDLNTSWAMRSRRQHARDRGKLNKAPGDRRAA